MIRARVLVTVTWMVLVALAGAGPRRTASAAAPDCRWTIETKNETEVRFRMDRRHQGDHSVWSTSVDPSELHGLDRGRIAGAPGPVRFVMVRESGTVEFTGTAGRGRASGTFIFLPNADWSRELGVTLDTRIDESTQLHLWQMDYRRADVREAAALLEGPIRISDLSELAVHGARGERLRALRDAGLKPGSSSDVAQLFIHGVTPEEVAALKALRGVAPVPADLVTLHIHGMPPSELRALAGLGYRDASADELASLRIHGIESGYVRELHALGYRDLAVDDLVSLRTMGVTPKFVRRILALAETRPSVEKLVELKARGFGD